MNDTQIPTFTADIFSNRKIASLTKRNGFMAKTIASSTALLPQVVADGVISNLAGWLENNIFAVSASLTGEERALEIVRGLISELDAKQHEYSRRLSQRAELDYAMSRHFKDILNRPGDEGRDALYSFMQVWLVQIIEKTPWKVVLPGLPHDYKHGSPLPEPKKLEM